MLKQFMYTVIHILIFNYVSICTGKKEHEKMSTKVVTVVLHFNGMITDNYFLNSIYLHFYKDRMLHFYN